MSATAHAKFPVRTLPVSDSLTLLRTRPSRVAMGRDHEASLHRAIVAVVMVLLVAVHASVVQARRLAEPAPRTAFPAQVTSLPQQPHNPAGGPHSAAHAPRSLAELSLDGPWVVGYVNSLSSWWPPEALAGSLGVPGYEATRNGFNVIVLGFWTTGGPVDAAAVWADPISSVSTPNPWVRAAAASVPRSAACGAAPRLRGAVTLCLCAPDCCCRGPPTHKCKLRGDSAFATPANPC